ncbi:MAG: hypothetical protein MHPSP_002916, partial [Paramarteilia canceri]
MSDESFDASHWPNFGLETNLATKLDQVFPGGPTEVQRCMLSQQKQFDQNSTSFMCAAKT